MEEWREIYTALKQELFKAKAREDKLQKELSLFTLNALKMEMEGLGDGKIKAQEKKLTEDVQKWETYIKKIEERLRIAKARVGLSETDNNHQKQDRNREQQTRVENTAERVAVQPVDLVSKKRSPEKMIVEQQRNEEQNERSHSDKAFCREVRTEEPAVSYARIFERLASSASSIADTNHSDDFERKNQRCMKCHKSGHNENECPTQECSNCHRPGHARSACPTLECFSCGRKGHSEAVCRSRKCSNCGKAGHTAEECRKCYNCGRMGHNGKECRAPPQTVQRVPSSSLDDILPIYDISVENEYVLDSGW